MKHKVILIADDDQFMLDNIHREFKPEDFKILKALNGEQALQILNKPNVHVDLIITNYRMPIVDGIELASIVRTSKKFSYTPMILTSVTPPYYYEIFLERNLFDKILHKPFTFELLLNEVKQLLNKE